MGKLIGKGSFGKVYLASHKLTNGSKVVLKSARKEDANLAREIHHHRQFLHPHIARLFEVVVTESMVWLVLEYCPGEELYNQILQNGRMEASKVQKIFTQLVGAVSYVHAKQCVHQALLIQYCRQLGKDGVGLFFKRITTSGHQAGKLFTDDVNTTYAKIRDRATQIAKEREEER